MKATRQRLIADIIRSNPVSSQEELATLLRRRGEKVTQATLSRDLEEIGAYKARHNGSPAVYRVPDDPAEAKADWLRRMLTEFVTGIASSGNILVLRTPPGGASAVARAIDAADLTEVLGTVAGDDTIFIVSRAEKGGAKLAKTFEGLMHKEA